MDSMRNTFYMVISGLQSDLYRALVDEGLFTTNPQTTTRERIATTNELSVFKDGLSTRTIRDSNESITMASTSVPDHTPTADELA